jgi:arginyl-tRNA synthetase
MTGKEKAETNEKKYSDPLAGFQKSCQHEMEKASKKLQIKNIPSMEVPPTSELGDFAFPCFALVKELKKTPQQIAELLKDTMESIEAMKVSSVNGYLNFKIDLPILVKNTLPVILKSAASYGKSPDRGERIILEHTSANPNGPFHVGRARNPIIGDTLARVLRNAGYEVEVQYWVNDMGKQAAILGWGVSNIQESDLPEALSDKKDHELVRYYQSSYKLMAENSDIENEITKLIQEYERGNKEELEKLRKPCESVLSGMVESLERLNIFVDKFVWESESVLSGTVDEVIEKLKGAELCRDEDGAKYLDLESYDIAGKTSRFVFTRSDGTSLYTTRDLAYHSKKLQECDIAINILGEDHKLQAKQLQIALTIMGLENLPEVVFYSFVSLEEGKMSTRRGNVVYLDDLMEEAVSRARQEVEKRREDLSEDLKADIASAVGLGAIRYNIIRVQPEKKITFKWKDALNFEGNSAPFIQYSHARACSILRKSREEEGNDDGGIDAQLENYNLDLLSSPSEDELIRNLAKLPSLIKECARTRKPHNIAAYAYKTAALFNQFYKDCPVLTAESKDLRNSRLALVEATKWCLANTLEILGIGAPEQM